MYRIKTLNKISPAGLSVLDQTRYTISTDVENEDGILVRSADRHDYAFPDALPVSYTHLVGDDGFAVWHGCVLPF